MGGFTIIRELSVDSPRNAVGSLFSPRGEENAGACNGGDGPAIRLVFEASRELP